LIDRLKFLKVGLLLLPRKWWPWSRPRSLVLIVLLSHSWVEG